MANILVLNSGSGSQKVALYAIESKSPSAPFWQAGINSTTPGQTEGYFVAQITSVRGKEEINVPRDLPLPKKLETLIRASWEGQAAALTRRIRSICGHRVVHSGLEFSRATLITPRLKHGGTQRTAPLHNPQSKLDQGLPEILGGEVPQFAVFDTAFHRTCRRLRLLTPDLLNGLRKDMCDTASMVPVTGMPAKGRLRSWADRVISISVKSSATWEAAVPWPLSAERAA
jgi:acetate kinase